MKKENVVSLQAFDETQPILGVTQFTNATGTGSQAVWASSTAAYRIDNILAMNNDTIDHVVNLYLHVSGSDYLIGSANVPTGTGTAGTPAIDVLAAALPAAVVGLPIQSTNGIYAAMAVAVTSGHQVNLAAVGGQL